MLSMELNVVSALAELLAELKKMREELEKANNLLKEIFTEK